MDNCVIHSHVWIGDGVVIGKNCKIQAFAFIPTGVSIHENVFIGPRVTFTNDKAIADNGEEWTITPTIVGRGAKIGAGAVIVAGANIGQGAIVGAGAVVTKDVEPFTTVVGNPARVCKMK